MRYWIGACQHMHYVQPTCSMLYWPHISVEPLQLQLLKIWLHGFMECSDEKMTGGLAWQDAKWPLIIDLNRLNYYCNSYFILILQASDNIFCLYHRVWISQTLQQVGPMAWRSVLYSTTFCQIKFLMSRSNPMTRKGTGAWVSKLQGMYSIALLWFCVWNFCDDVDDSGQ